MNTYVIGDHHFEHKGIVKFERGEFSGTKEHDNYIIKRHNMVVSSGDLTYFLGDVGDKGSLASNLSRMNGRKRLIIGNHDKYSRGFYLDCGFEEVYDHPIFYNKFLILSHEPHPMAGNYYINAHGHLHGARLADDFHYQCMSAKNIGYTPVKIENLYLKQQNKLDRVKTKFLKEWYADLYVFNSKRDDIVMGSDGRIKLEKTKMLRLDMKNQSKCQY